MSSIQYPKNILVSYIGHFLSSTEQIIIPKDITDETKKLYKQRNELLEFYENINPMSSNYTIYDIQKLCQIIKTYEPQMCPYICEEYYKYIQIIEEYKPILDNIKLFNDVLDSCDLDSYFTSGDIKIKQIKLILSAILDESKNESITKKFITYNLPELLKNQIDYIQTAKEKIYISISLIRQINNFHWYICSDIVVHKNMSMRVIIMQIMYLKYLISLNNKEEET